MRLVDDLAKTFPNLYRDEPLATEWAGIELLSRAGEGGSSPELTPDFDGAVRALATSAIDENPWRQPAYAFVEEAWKARPDTPLGRKLTPLDRQKRQFDAVTGERYLRIGDTEHHGALLQVSDVEGFRAAFVESRQQTHARVRIGLLPAVPLDESAAVDVLLHDVSVVDAWRPWAVVAAARAITSRDVSVMRLWIDDDAASWDVIGPRNRIEEFHAVLEALR